MNYISQFLSDNGIEIWQRFRIKQGKARLGPWYWFDDDYALCVEESDRGEFLTEFPMVLLLSGKAEIFEKEPILSTAERRWY